MDQQQMTEQAQMIWETFGPQILAMSTNVIAAITILVIGWGFAKWAHNSLRRLMERTNKIDNTLKPLLASLVRYAIMIFVIIAVLAKFGVQTASIITVLGAAGLAIGLALQGTLANIAAGVMLLFLRPMKIGEYIDAEGHAGTVMEIGLFTTTFKTYDGVYYEVPNAQIWNKAIKNYSRNPTRRIDVVAGISYDDDVDSALALLLDVLKKDERVLDDPAPETMVVGLGDNSVNLNMRCWVNASDYWNMLFNMHRQARLQLDANGFTIPYPQRDVYLYESTEQRKKLDSKLAKQAKASPTKVPVWPEPANESVSKEKPSNKKIPASKNRKAEKKK